MAAVRPSTFIHKLYFKTPVGSEQDTSNTRGDVQLAYQDAFSKWASLEPLMGRELLVAQQMRADVTHKVTTHRDDRINHRLIFVWNSRTFYVGPVLGLDGERGRYMSFYAVEVKG